MQGTSSSRTKRCHRTRVSRCRWPNANSRASFVPARCALRPALGRSNDADAAARATVDRASRKPRDQGSSRCSPPPILIRRSYEAIGTVVSPSRFTAVLMPRWCQRRQMVNIHNTQGLPCVTELLKPPRKFLMSGERLKTTAASASSSLHP